MKVNYQIIETNQQPQKTNQQVTEMNYQPY